MTLVEKLQHEGKLEGKLEGLLETEIKGLREAIELGITLKLPEDTDTLTRSISTKTRRAIDDAPAMRK